MKLHGGPLDGLVVDDTPGVEVCVPFTIAYPTYGWMRYRIAVPDGHALFDGLLVLVVGMGVRCDVEG